MQAAGVSHDNPRAKTSTFKVPTDQNRTKIPREDLQREEKRHKKTPGERQNQRRKKKSEILGGPAEGCPAEGGPAEGGPNQGGRSIGPNRSGHQKSAKPFPKSAKPRRVGKIGPKSAWPGQTRSWPNKVVAKQGRGQTRSWPNKVVAKQGRGQTRSGQSRS